MKYDKPEVTVLGSGINAIESVSKGDEFQIDQPLNVTHAAYEADE
jgi:hypothetical protein